MHFANRRPLPLAILALGLILPAVSRAENNEHHHQGWECCAEKRAWMMLRAPSAPGPGGGPGGPPPSPEQYAPDRRIDVAHLKLDLTPDYETRTLAGISELRFAPIASPLRTLELDAADELRIADVEASREIEAYQQTGSDKLAITFAEPIAPGQETVVTIHYSAEPSEGWYFRTEAMGYPAGDDHAFTQGQPERHRHWFPGYDYPNERFTTEVICRVPEGMTVVSNGRLLGSEKDADTGLIAYHWLQDKPHVNYLITVVAGYLERLEDAYGDLPLAFYTPPSEFANAANSFRDTAAILDFFEDEIGVAYPWDKYYNLCVSDFVSGGMENTSATTLTSGTLFSEATENIFTTHRLDAHEVAHQWFGDLITCQDWSNLWLNEGFATYYTQLYEEHKSGLESAQYGMYRNASTVFRHNDDKPITWRGYRDAWEQFDYRAYPKGAWVLHMLRSQLGAELYRDCIRTYVERHRDQVVVTRDLVEVIEEKSGRSWERFFDQWVHHGGHPKLKVAYRWDQEAGKASLMVQQTQQISERVMRFEFPLPVRFITEDGVHDFVADVRQPQQNYSWELPSAPVAVRVDPDYTLLAEIDFDLPDPLLHAQLELENDMMGRLLATIALGGRKDRTSVAKLAERLAGDSFYGVRIEAARALSTTHTPEALAALLAAPPQQDARARQEVVMAIGRFYDERAYAALVDVIENEANPEIVVSALSAVGKFPEESVEGLILTALRRDSFRNQIAVAAISAAQVSAESSLATPILDYLRGNEAAFVSRDFSSVLNSLAVLVAEEEDNAPIREATRDYITPFVNHPKERIRLGAMKALGALGDHRSIAVLGSFLTSSEEKSPEAEAAEKAIDAIRDGRPQAPELKELRKEVMELQQALQRMQQGPGPGPGPGPDGPNGGPPPGAPGPPEGGEPRNAGKGEPRPDN